MFRYSRCHRKTDRHGCDGHLLSKGPCRSLYPGHTGRVVLEISEAVSAVAVSARQACSTVLLRERDLSMLKDYAITMLKNTGHEEISLSSLSSSDYSELAGIVNFLIEHCEGQGINISLPSLRIDAFFLDVMSKVQDIKKKQPDLRSRGRFPADAKCHQ